MWRWLFLWRKTGSSSASCTTTPPAPPSLPPVPTGLASELPKPATYEQAISGVHRDMCIAAMRSEASGLAAVGTFKEPGEPSNEAPTSFPND